MDNKELVLKALKDSENPLKAQEIADITGLKKAEVDKILKILKEENLIESPKRCYYTASNKGE
ncbi:ArsR family transcriptional regulator [Caldicellulosiruptoraceae bacterium PP1]